MNYIQHQTMYFGGVHVPRVIVQHIASWLQGHEELLRLRTTCRWAWRNIKIYELPPRYDCMPSYVSFTDLKKICPRYAWLEVRALPSSLEYLDIRSIFPIELKDIMHLVNLRELHVRRLQIKELEWMIDPLDMSQIDKSFMIPIISVYRQLIAGIWRKTIVTQLRPTAPHLKIITYSIVD